MKKWIQQIIEDFIREYEKSTVTKWGSPLVGFADAGAVASKMPEIMKNHGFPQDALDNPRIIIAYYVPFLKEMAETNNQQGPASKEWARGYEETNVMLGKINAHLIAILKENGYRAAVHPESGSFDREKLISNWSHRHVAYMAGLGTFGINNMLITEKGCCGRYSTVITDLDVVPDSLKMGELCMYRADGSCLACVSKCPSGALTKDGFDRHKCYEVCKQNADIYTSFGNSYGSEEGVAVGSEVCGKCVAGMPCAFL